MIDPNRYRPRRARKQWLEGAPPHIVAVYDAGPNFGDRYTVLYGAPIWSPQYCEANARCGRDPRLLPARAMSSDPFSPQGIGLFVEALRGDHLGNKIKWADLPDKCKQLAIRDGEELDL